jgi:hypothetical protein
MLVTTRDQDGLVDPLAKDESAPAGSCSAESGSSVTPNLASRARRAAQSILRSRLTTYGIAAISLLLLALIALIVRTITQQEELEPT